MAELVGNSQEPGWASQLSLTHNLLMKRWSIGGSGGCGCVWVVQIMTKRWKMYGFAPATHNRFHLAQVLIMSPWPLTHKNRRVFFFTS